jgi:hypothetical protein
MELGKSNKEEKEEAGSIQKEKKSTKNGLLPNGNEWLHLGGPYPTNHVF